MSIRYTIDRENCIVRSRGWGVVTASDVQDWISHLLADPLFDSEYRSLGDLRAVSHVAVDARTLAQVAATPLFHVGALRAVVASSDCVFGMARTFAGFAERVGQQVRVFREMHLAEEWLGLLIAPAGGAPVSRAAWEPLVAA